MHLKLIHQMTCQWLAHHWSKSKGWRRKRTKTRRMGRTTWTRTRTRNKERWESILFTMQNSDCANLHPHEQLNSAKEALSHHQRFEHKALPSRLWGNFIKFSIKLMSHQAMQSKQWQKEMRMYKRTMWNKEQISKKKIVGQKV